MKALLFLLIGVFCLYAGGEYTLTNEAAGVQFNNYGVYAVFKDGNDVVIEYRNFNTGALISTKTFTASYGQVGTPQIFAKDNSCYVIYGDGDRVRMGYLKNKDGNPASEWSVRTVPLSLQDLKGFDAYLFKYDDGNHILSVSAVFYSSNTYYVRYSASWNTNSFSSWSTVNAVSYITELPQIAYMDYTNQELIFTWVEKQGLYRKFYGRYRKNSTWYSRNLIATRHGNMGVNTMDLGANQQKVFLKWCEPWNYYEELRSYSMIFGADNNWYATNWDGQDDKLAVKMSFGYDASGVGNGRLYMVLSDGDNVKVFNAAYSPSSPHIILDSQNNCDVVDIDLETYILFMYYPEGTDATYYRTYTQFHKVLAGPANISEMVPTDFTVNVYPNPFNPTTTIEIKMPIADNLKINIYNVLGQSVYRYSQFLGVGVHRFEFNGRFLPSGEYFVIVNDGQLKEKTLLVK